jgi:hypothetical protein
METGMAEIEGIEVRGILGWKTTNDGKHVLVGLKQGSGAEFALAVTPESLFEVANAMLAVAGQVQNQRGAQQQTASVFRPDWFETGDIHSSNDVALTFYMPDEVAISFALPPAMVAGLAETLGVAAGHVSIALPPGTKTN